MSTQSVDLNDDKYAKSEAEAEYNYHIWKEMDPFPNIVPALLNSADIDAYIQKTSFIYPFHKINLKGASYDVKMQGKIIYWEEEKKDKKEIILKDENNIFELKPNSIAFVTLEPTFRIPEYLALRFNLKITHIYKGLLLGTGPLVDPGFQGKLSIPLHNLTANTYHFNGLEQLITIEVTKLSPCKLWRTNTFIPPHDNKYIHNKITANRTVDQYINKALVKDNLNSIISSIPSAIVKSQNEIIETKNTINKSIQKAEDELKDIRAQNKIISFATLIGGVSVIIAGLTLVYAISQFFFSLITEIKADLRQIQNQVQNCSENIEILKMSTKEKTITTEITPPKKMSTEKDSE